MAIRDEKALHVVMYEGVGATALAPQERLSALTAFLQAGYAVTCSTDEREVPPPDPRVPNLVFGRFQEGATPPSNGQTDVWFEEIGDHDANRLAERVESVRTKIAAATHGSWKPWFPVIDYDRCTNCMQCLSFCLFGVYGVDAEQRIQVQNQDNCKTNCPACSRVCPEAAIMFPKYKAGPINGDVVSDSDLQREKMKIDISALLGGDVYSMLRERSDRAKTRFSKERDSNKALQERQKCLVKLAENADIPPEVLMSLPSPEEIQRRAQEAAAKAAAALAHKPNAS